VPATQLYASLAHVRIYSSAYLLIYISTQLRIYSSTRLLIYPSTHLLIYISTYLLIGSSTHLHMYSSTQLLMPDGDKRARHLWAWQLCRDGERSLLTGGMSWFQTPLRQPLCPVQCGLWRGVGLNVVRCGAV
jgi:hypothetical protein